MKAALRIHQNKMLKRNSIFPKNPLGPFFLLLVSANFMGLTWAQASNFQETATPYSWQSIPSGTSLDSPPTGLSLLKWKDGQQNPPPPPVRFDRVEHFGGWLSFRDDRSCLDVRNRVLIRDSQKEIELKPNNPCKILAGHWQDPYGGQTHKDPLEVDVDHLVALKNAYDNGAWKWTPQMRCLYANYMGFRDHLKTVSRSENRIKSAKDPSEYMPPNPAYRCEFLKRWLSVKLIWKLSLRIEEAVAIRNHIANERCNPDDFVFSQAELRMQRQKIQNLLPICSFKGTPPPPAPAPVPTRPSQTPFSN